MAHWPSAFACHVSRPSRSDLPTDWTAKSTIVVVPPQAAARDPVSKVSDAAVPPKGSSMCVCVSTPPGMTYSPVASSTFSAAHAAATPLPVAATPTTFSPSISTSAFSSSDAVMTRPFLISVRMAESCLRQRAVSLRAPIAVERPLLAHLLDQLHVEVAHDELLRLVRGHVADELPARVHEVAGAVEVVVPVLLDPDAVDRGHVVLVRDRRRGLLQLPEV